MIAYKIFHVRGGKLYSFLATRTFFIGNNPHYRYLTRYQIRKKNYSNLQGTPILCFDNPRSANLFAGDNNVSTNGRYELWEVECSEDSFPVKYVLPQDLSEDLIRRFWEVSGGLHSIDWYDVIMQAPKGTLACEWIIPQKKLELEPIRGYYDNDTSSGITQ